MMTLVEELREIITKMNEVQKPLEYSDWTTQERLIWMLTVHYNYSAEGAVVKAEEIAQETLKNSKVYESFRTDLDNEELVG